MKKPPPNGYTGYDAMEPSYPDIMAWIEDHPDGNLALHLPRGVIGLDVDAYGAKTGEATFIEALNRWGALPPTVRSTSRPDGVSGIRLYRVQPEIQLRTEIKFPEQNVANIEVIQFTHRYVVSWPSIHPDTKATYEWLDESGAVVGIPNIEDLPWLPQRWVDGLRVEQITEITNRVNPFDALKGLPSGPMSKAVSDCFVAAVKHLDTDPGSRHDAAMRDVMRLLRLGEQGETGVPLALNEFGKVFAHATRDRNTASEAAGEYARMVYGQRGHDLIASTPTANVETLVDPSERSVSYVGAPSAERHEKSSGVDSQAGMVDGVREALSPEAARQLMATTGYEVRPEPDDDLDDDVNGFLFGTVTQEALKAEPDLSRDESPKSMRDKLLSISQLANIKPALPMVDKLLYQGTLAQIAGDPGSFKTFFTLGLACAVASNLDSWETYAVAKHGPVIYVAAEGVSGVRARILAWCEDQNVDPDTLNLHLYPEPIQLGSYNEIDELTNLAVDLGAVLVIFDTRARCTSDLNENDATEQDVAIRHAEKIRMASGATVLMIHHSARSGTAGRGSNAWDGAVWSDMRLSAAGKVVTVKCEKHKDAESHCTHEFVMMNHTIGEDLMPDTEEEMRKTLVIVTKETAPNAVDGNGDTQEQILELLRNQALEDGYTAKKLEELCDSNHATVYRSIKRLEGLGQVKNIGTTARPRYAATVS
jgi:hypothetical protein